MVSFRNSRRNQTRRVKCNHKNWPGIAGQNQKAPLRELFKFRSRALHSLPDGRDLFAQDLPRIAFGINDPGFCHPGQAEDRRGQAETQSRQGLVVKPGGDAVAPITARRLTVTAARESADLPSAVTMATLVNVVWP